MEKFLLFINTVLISVSIHANTCIYDNTHATLKKETVTVSNTGYISEASFTITVSDTTKESIRIHVEVGEERQWITVKLNNGIGIGKVKTPLSVKSGTVLPIKLIQNPETCY